MKNQIVFFLALFTTVLSYSQEPVQDIFQRIRPLMGTLIETDTILATDGNRVVSKIPLSLINQNLILTGPNLTISGAGGNTVDLSTLGGGGAWGSIIGTLSNQADLQAALDAKQNNLVSATNIRTINGLDILGSGDLVVTASGSEANDLTAGVTWANIPDANVPLTAVKQHEGLLAITESQITDLAHNDLNALRTDGTRAMTNDLSTGSNNIDMGILGKIINLADPVANQDATTKIYVDAGRASGSETKINAGTNISVTGNGQVLTPYVINSTGGGTNHIDANSPVPSFDFAAGTNAELDNYTPAGGFTFELATDAGGSAGTDGFVTGIGVTGVSTKTITLTRNGLPDIFTTFTDDGAGGAGDGNDYLTGVTESLGVLTFSVLNQTDPTFNIGAYLNSKNYSVGNHTVDTNTQLTELQVDNFVSNNGYSTGAHTIDTKLSTEEVQDISGGMFSGNTETGITATYQDTDGTIDLVFSPADNSINGAKIITNTLSGTKVLTASLSGTKIIPETIGSTELTSGSITSIKIVPNAITSDKIAFETVTKDDIADNSIDISKIIETNFPQPGWVLSYTGSDAFTWIPNPKPFTSYVARVTQNSTSAPSAAILFNDTSGWTWSRQSSGIYRVTPNVPASYNPSATHVVFTQQNGLGNNISAKVAYAGTYIQIVILNGTTVQDGMLNGTIKIEQY